LILLTDTGECEPCLSGPDSYTSLKEVGGFAVKLLTRFRDQCEADELRSREFGELGVEVNASCHCCGTNDFEVRLSGMAGNSI